MNAMKEQIMNGSLVGLLGIVVALSAQHPEMVKDFVLFFLAWVLLKKGVSKELGKIGSVFSGEIEKITKSIERLTETMASLEKNHDARLTNLEIKVDKLTENKLGQKEL